MFKPQSRNVGCWTEGVNINIHLYLLPADVWISFHVENIYQIVYLFSRKVYGCKSNLVNLESSTCWFARLNLRGIAYESRWIALKLSNKVHEDLMKVLCKLRKLIKDLFYLHFSILEGCEFEIMKIYITMQVERFFLYWKSSSSPLAREEYRKWN